MGYHVQAEVRKGSTVYIGWYECGDLLASKFEEGFELHTVWDNTILMDKKGVDGSDLRSIVMDTEAIKFQTRLVKMRSSLHKLEE